MYNVKQDENKFTNNYINKYNTKTFLKIYHSKYKEKKFRKLINLIGRIFYLTEGMGIVTDIIMTNGQVWLWGIQEYFIRRK